MFNKLENCCDNVCARETEVVNLTVGTWLWACAKAEAGEKMQSCNVHHDSEVWRDAPPWSLKGPSWKWRIKPKPVVPPTLEECLDALEALRPKEKADSYIVFCAAVMKVQNILKRAGRLPKKEGE